MGRGVRGNEGIVEKVKGVVVSPDFSPMGFSRGSFMGERIRGNGGGGLDEMGRG